LERVGLSARLGQKPDRLSRGEQQRAAVARAVLHPHDLILADEPTASLDRANADMVMDFLIGMASDNGSALLVATHDPLVMKKLPGRFELPKHRFAGDAARGGRKQGIAPAP
jgi:ABC-type lipoprotein export system ATPase subunit